MNRIDTRSKMQQRALVIDIGSIELLGDLSTPRDARGVVVFAHGSGSSRTSPRNQAVARKLNDAGFATLLFDLLTPSEEVREQGGGALRFDVDRLAKRLVAAIDHLDQDLALRALPLGFFGASTGAAAALIAATLRPERVRAIVSRGGRPDLAERVLDRVRAPTLLIVGGADPVVLELNRSAFARLGGAKELHIVPGAAHLFEEQGALDEVAASARSWFARHLEPRAVNGRFEPKGLERARTDPEC